MFTKRLLFTLLFLVSILLAACTPPPATPQAPPVEPTSVPPTAVPTAVPTTAPTAVPDALTLVQLYYAAIEAGDVAKAMTFVSDNYVMTDPTGYTRGKEASTAAWQGYFDAGFTFDQSDFKAAGNRVTSCFKVYQDGALIDQGCSAVTHVRDGKITFDGLVMAEAQFIVEEYYAALNANNIDDAMSFIAEDALFINPMGSFTGQEEIRASLEDLFKEGITFELSNFRDTDGRVVYDYKVLVQGEVVETGTDGLTIVKDGRVVFDGTERTEAGYQASMQPDTQPTIPEVTYAVSEHVFDGPSEIEGGWVKLTLTNEGQEAHHLQLIKLLEGKTMDDLNAALSTDGENFPTWAIPYGGPNAPDPGGTTSAIVYIDPGSYAMICVIPDAEGIPHFIQGMVAPLTVTEPTGPVADEPLADITINLTEFTFLVSGELTPGEHIIRFNNAGTQVHEAYLVKLNDGVTAEDYLNTPLGEIPPAISLGGITGIVPGDDNYIPVTLEAGEYALYCFFIDPTTHAPHFVQGMVLQLTVK